MSAVPVSGRAGHASLGMLNYQHPLRSSASPLSAFQPLPFPASLPSLHHSSSQCAKVCFTPSEQSDGSKCIPLIYWRSLRLGGAFLSSSPSLFFSSSSVSPIISQGPRFYLRMRPSVYSWSLGLASTCRENSTPQSCSTLQIINIDKSRWRQCGERRQVNIDLRLSVLTDFCGYPSNKTVDRPNKQGKNQTDGGWLNTDFLATRRSKA
ncbi:hypothetical protein J6590_004636 [Homalodisca vitripennis]|nr:hypothetical protein J6590_004636 [Homalodisca vitripennis]